MIKNKSKIAKLNKTKKNFKNF